MTLKTNCLKKLKYKILWEGVCVFYLFILVKSHLRKWPVFSLPGKFAFKIASHEGSWTFCYTMPQNEEYLSSQFNKMYKKGEKKKKSSTEPSWVGLMVRVVTLSRYRRWQVNGMSLGDFRVMILCSPTSFSAHQRRQQQWLVLGVGQGLAAELCWSYGLPKMRPDLFRAHLISEQHVRVLMESRAQFPTLYQIALHPTMMCEMLAVSYCLKASLYPVYSTWYLK